MESALLLDDYRIELMNAQRLQNKSLIKYYSAIVGELKSLSSSRRSCCAGFCATCNVPHVFPAHADCRPVRWTLESDRSIESPASEPRR